MPVSRRYRNKMKWFTDQGGMLQGGICLQAASRGLFSLKPPRVVVPKVIVPAVENLFNAFRALDNAELDHKLIGLEVSLLPP
jgi:hypothetical protein